MITSSKIFITIATLVLIVVGVLMMLNEFPGFQPSPQSIDKKAPIKIGIIRYLKIYDSEVGAFKAGLTDLGYQEGKDVIYEREDVDRVEDVNVAAKKLIENNVNLIYAITTVAASGTIIETQKANRTDIPIVFANGNEPVRAGIAKSFKSSGNNATGVAVNFVELTSKKLEFMKIINPTIKKIGYFDAVYTDPAAKFSLEELKNQAPKFGITLVRYPLVNPVGPAATIEIKKILADIKLGEIDGYYHLPGPLLPIPEHTAAIREMLGRLRIPGVWIEPPSVELGGLFTYSHELIAIGKQASVIADKVLKGTLPTDIPIEFAQKYNLVINLKTARESGITIPQSLLDIANIKIDK